MCPKDEVGCEVAGGLVVDVVEAGSRTKSQASKKPGKERVFTASWEETFHQIGDIFWLTKLIHQLGFVGQRPIVVRTGISKAEMENDVPP